MPWEHGGPARACTTSWRPSPSRLHVSLKWMLRSHMESDLDILYMAGKIISRGFQWNWFASGVNENRPRKLTSCFCPGAATPSFGFWALYHVGAHYGRIQGVLHDPREFISSRHTLVRVWIFLRLFYQE
jgi:hypothetical protein